MGRATTELDMTPTEKATMLGEVATLHAAGKITDEAFEYLKGILS